MCYKPWNIVAGKQLKVIYNSTMQADAAVMGKLTQVHKEQQGNAIGKNEPRSQDTGFWMEDIQENLLLENKAFARCIHLPNLI